jgi:peptidoglycan hydrolase FlgJ
MIDPGQSPAAVSAPDYAPNNSGTQNYRTNYMGTNSRSGPAAAHDAQLDPKLVAAAHQFEASLMAELLKPLNSGESFGGDDDAGAAGGALSDLTSSADGSGGALMSFGSEALAKAISEKGGLGIARRVLDNFEAAKTARDADTGVVRESGRPLQAGAEIPKGIRDYY